MGYYICDICDTMMYVVNDNRYDSMWFNTITGTFLCSEHNDIVLGDMKYDRKPPYVHPRLAPRWR